MACVGIRSSAIARQIYGVSSTHRTRCFDRHHRFAHSTRSCVLVTMGYSTTGKPPRRNRMPRRILLHAATLFVVLVWPATAVQIQKQDIRNMHFETRSCGRRRRPSAIYFTGGGIAVSRKWLFLGEGYEEIFDESLSSTSQDFAMDPLSDEARSLTRGLGISEEQHEKLERLASLVVEWNERINLVSRKDCTDEVIFGRHILPSVALMATPQNPFESAKKVIDVGTGGGFPGLPLAIVYPDLDFMLVDSVGKKLKAVEGMAEGLGLANVRVHHGRAEEMTDDVIEGPRHTGAYDVCVGRSVAALPKFCFWISELLRPSTESEQGGKLVYIVGGDINDALVSRAQSEVEIDRLLGREGASDKRILVFGHENVARIAAESGEVKRKRGTPRIKKKPKRTKRTKGAWTTRDESVTKERGYEDFKRYNG